MANIESSGSGSADAADVRLVGTAARLPSEILIRIVSFLLPSIDVVDSTYPHPSIHDLDYVPALPLTAIEDLRDVSCVSPWLYHVATELLWRSPLLRNLKALNRLALAVLKDKRESKGILIRALHLPPGDGLLQTTDTLADQNSYQNSLRTLLDHAPRIQCLVLEHRQAGSALLEFLHPATVCRPTNVTLSNLSFSAPPFSSLDLAPLSQVERLHLIKVVPPPALLSFLCGKQINNEPQGTIIPALIQHRLTPNRTLTHLRFSLLPPDTLLYFQSYVDWRKTWAVFERLSAQEQASNPAPRAPLGPARRFAVQEALYDMAMHSAQFEQLICLMIEVSALAPLLSPSESEEDLRDVYSATSIDSRGVPIPNGENPDLYDPRASPEDMVSTEPIILSTEPSINDLEDLRTRPRDEYWKLVRDGKRALVELWEEGRSLRDLQSAKQTSIRVVAARPGGHDRREGYLDYLCQSSQETTAPKAETSVHEITALHDGEVGCWADEDVFHLARSRPYLSHRVTRSPLGSTRLWWTGELPRLYTD